MPFNDEDALREAVAAVGEDLAAVLLEPVQGEGGVIPSTPAYLALARELTTAAGALLILDAVSYTHLDVYKRQASRSSPPR